MCKHFLNLIFKVNNTEIGKFWTKLRAVYFLMLHYILYKYLIKNFQQFAQKITIFEFYFVFLTF